MIKNFLGITTEEQAKQFLEELRKLENDRMHIEGDYTFVDYYNSKYNELVKRFPSENIKNMQYAEFEFKPLYNENEKENLEKNAILTLADLTVKYEDLKRYRFQKEDVVFDVITIKDKPFVYQCFSDNNMITNGNFAQDKFVVSTFKAIGRDVTVTKNQDDGLKVYAGRNYEREGGVFLDGEILQETVLGVTKEEWNEKIESLKRENEKFERIQNSGIRGIIKKIRSIFTKQEPKLLLPSGGDQVVSEEAKNVQQNEFDAKLKVNSNGTFIPTHTDKKPDNSKDTRQEDDRIN